MTRAIRTGAVLAALGAFAAPAQAAELVRESYEDMYGGSSYHVVYTAGAGEANQVTAAYDHKTETFTLTDAGVQMITPTQSSLTGCRHWFDRVTCPGVTQAGYNDFTFEFHLGDRDDSLSFATSRGLTQLYGGAGNDALGHAGLGVLDADGGDGDDAVTKTGRGVAHLGGGAGDDVLQTGEGGGVFANGPGADTMIGGPGLDRMSYAGAPAAVNVSYDGVANDGAPGEGDDVTDAIEHLDGSAYADTLTGDEHAQGMIGGYGDDVIDGGAGDDQLIGREGADHLIGGAGVDWVYGGNPNTYAWYTDGGDLIDVRDGGFDRYGCGKGTDRVVADAADVLEYPEGSWAPPVPAECETVELP